ncbi:hypothetical protein Bca52824_023439 [Brassica carinata]|uniref:Uncharacterized protein n=1 Tax=Brassica carinata TaxID=52824 RepID=A0A8X7VIJ7_BRACI|nr:hypothetical protein Bca52824_023439 [Brassica carinata]
MVKIGRMLRGQSRRPNQCRRFSGASPHTGSRLLFQRQIRGLGLLQRAISASTSRTFKMTPSYGFRFLGSSQSTLFGEGLPSAS